MNTGSYINGKWYQPSSKTISKNINPADTSDVIAEYPLATAADVRTGDRCGRGGVAGVEEDARTRARPRAVARRRHRARAASTRSRTR